MIKCLECIERLKPDDPRVRSGKYNRCGCDYCDKPTYFIELEGVRDPQPSVQPRPIVNVTYQIDARSTPAFKELKDEITLINGRLTEYFEDKKKRTNRYNTYK